MIHDVQAWCKRFEVFDKIHRLSGVPVITVQLRYSGWVTELGPNPAAYGKNGSNPDVPQRLSSDPADPNAAGRLAFQAVREKLFLPVFS